MVLLVLMTTNTLPKTIILNQALIRKVLNGRLALLFSITASAHLAFAYVGLELFKDHAGGHHLISLLLHIGAFSFFFSF